MTDNDTRGGSDRPSKTLCRTCMGAGKVLEHVMKEGTSRYAWLACRSCRPGPHPRAVKGP